MAEADTDERVYAAPPPARGRGFAVTWWGQRWLRALEDTALDGALVRQGRRHARAGAVGAVSVRPGRLTAVVRDADGTAHRADVLLRQLTAAEWDRLLSAIAREAGHLAALLDAELPPALVEDAEAAGVELLPGIGDLEPSCECGEWDHCAHTAALCYQVARVLDADPFVVLRLRGRTERALLTELRRRSRRDGEERTPPEAASAVAEPAGLPAAEAYARPVAPLPPPPPPVARAGTPATFAGDMPPGPGLDVGALEFLAASAARRARGLLAAALAPVTGDAARGTAEPGAPGAFDEPGALDESAGASARTDAFERTGASDELDGPGEHEGLDGLDGLDEWQDAARLASQEPPARVLRRLAEGCGRTPEELELAARAWRLGGPPALAVLEDAALPVPARAVALLATAWEREDPAARPATRRAGNRWTVVGGDAQLRCGPDGRWWPYRRRGGRWVPVGPAEAEPTAALAAALGDDQGSEE
ncbi:SWIM zinc finger family protein [Streptomyces sp. 4N509B]|uniref:SWIM zinc finger family protein n=1 Tax=Streptomyces sp. 4N509B TaxID=3457413 RepID=UPI003FD33544